MEVDVAQESMEEDTDEEDHQVRVNTPDLVREFSDLVEFGEAADTLSLVLNSSSEDQTEDNKDTSQQPEQKKPAADAGDEGQMVMEEQQE